MNYDDRSAEAVSNQLLNAFVDDELDAAERAVVVVDSDRSETTDTRLKEYRKLKDLVSLAYASVPEPQAIVVSEPGAKRFRLTRIFSTAAVVLIGLSIGALLWLLPDETRSSHLASATLPSGNKATVVDHADRVMVHLATNNYRSMNAALTRAEFLIASHTTARPVMVEILTNQEGIDLLRSDLTPFAERVALLADKNVVFVACARRVENLLAQNEAVHLLPQARYSEAVLDRVVGHLQAGWRYEKI